MALRSGARVALVAVMIAVFTAACGPARTTASSTGAPPPAAQASGGQVSGGQQSGGQQSGGQASVGPLPTLQEAPTAAPQTVSRTGYKPLAQALLEERRAIEQLVTKVDSDAGISNTERAAEVRGDIVPALQRLESDADAVEPDDATVRSVHQHLLISLRTAITAFTDLADGLQTGDQAVFARGQSERHAEGVEFKAWVDGLRGLYASGGS